MMEPVGKKTTLWNLADTLKCPQVRVSTRIFSSLNLLFSRVLDISTHQKIVDNHLYSADLFLFFSTNKYILTTVFISLRRTLNL